MIFNWKLEDGWKKMRVTWMTCLAHIVILLCEPLSLWYPFPIDDNAQFQNVTPWNLIVLVNVEFPVRCWRSLQNTQKFEVTLKSLSGNSQVSLTSTFATMTYQSNLIYCYHFCLDSVEVSREQSPLDCTLPIDSHPTSLTTIFPESKIYLSKVQGMKVTWMNQKQVPICP